MHIYVSKTSLQIITLTFVFAVITHYGFTYASNWTPPQTSPPANNVATPLNEGTDDQVKSGGLSVNSLLSTGEIVGMKTGNSGQFRMVGGNYGSMIYNDSADTYLLLTNQNDALGSYNNLRPFFVHNATGLVNMNQGLSVNAGNISVNGKVDANNYVWSPQLWTDNVGVSNSVTVQGQVNSGKYCDQYGGNCSTAAEITTKGTTINIPACHTVTAYGIAPDYVATAYCSAGEVALNGGGECALKGSFGVSGDHGFLHTNRPVGTNGWVADCFQGNWSGEVNARAVATCCPVS